METLKVKFTCILIAVGVIIWLISKIPEQWTNRIWWAIQWICGAIGIAQIICGGITVLYLLYLIVTGHGCNLP